MVAESRASALQSAAAGKQSELLEKDNELSVALVESNDLDALPSPAESQKKAAREQQRKETPYGSLCGQFHPVRVNEYMI
jgi:hypothetical protein